MQYTDDDKKEMTNQLKVILNDRVGGLWEIENFDMFIQGLSHLIKLSSKTNFTFNHGNDTSVNEKDIIFIMKELYDTGKYNIYINFPDGDRYISIITYNHGDNFISTKIERLKKK